MCSRWGQVARWANPWIWANPESVEFALELISSLRQSIDGGRLDTVIFVGYTTLESSEPEGNDDSRILTMLGKALVMRYIQVGLPADGGARLRSRTQRSSMGGQQTMRNMALWDLVTNLVASFSGTS